MKIEHHGNVVEGEDIEIPIVVAGGKQGFPSLKIDLKKGNQTISITKYNPSGRLSLVGEFSSFYVLYSNFVHPKLYFLFRACIEVSLYFLLQVFNLK